MESNKRINYLINIITCVLIAFIIGFVIYAYSIGVFSSKEAFQSFIESFGIWAAIIFVLIQTISVIVPFIPTSIGVVAGVLIFSPQLGFIYNYLGICIGSILAFMLSKRYGSPLVKKIIGEKSYDKYIGWTQESKKFNKMFAVAIVAPAAPDDLLCYIAGTTKMRYREYIPIILLGKPVSLFVYSIGITTIMHLIFSIFE